MRKKIYLFIVAALAVCMLTAMAACVERSNYDKLSYDKESEYGIYWYGDDCKEENAVKSTDITQEHFDKSKPTIFYCHGWKPGASADYTTKLEDLNTVFGEETDLVKVYKDKGYNVAALSWYRGSSVLTDLFGYIWSDLKWDKESVGSSLAVLFASEIADVMSDYDNEIIFAGHSYGTQVAVAVNYVLAKYIDEGVIANKSLVASKMSLADPYIGSLAVQSSSRSRSIDGINEAIGGREPAELVADCIAYLSGKGVAVEMYCGMPMAYDQYGSSDAEHDRIYEKLTANVVWTVVTGLQERYGTIGDIHNVTRDYMIISSKYEMKDENDAYLPTMALTPEQSRALKGKKYVMTSTSIDDFAVEIIPA